MSSIMEALRSSQAAQSAHAAPRVTLDSGELGISDAVFEVALYRLGVASDIVADWLLEPVERRDDILKYYEEKK